LSSLLFVFRSIVLCFLIVTLFLHLD
jgi:hypothetical protein